LPTRRQVIKVGLLGAAVLAGARYLGRPLAAPAGGRRALDKRDAAIVTALIPVVLDGSLPAEGEARVLALREVLEGFERAVSGLAPAIQDEVGELFGVLRFAPTRLAFTGLWSPIEQSTSEEIVAFLARWRASRFEIQRAGYQALTQLIQASWYDNPASWAAIGYPGPPALSN
jgi:hypothetical protein